MTENERRPKETLTRFILFIVTGFLFLHLMLYLFVRPDMPHDINTYFWPDMDEPIGHVIYGKTVLAEPGKHIAILGSSAPLRAFSPELLDSLLPGYRVHMFALTSSNLENSMKIFDMMIQSLPPEQKKDVTFVVSLLFSSFDSSRDPAWDVSDPFDGMPAFLQRPLRYLMLYGMTLRAEWKAWRHFRTVMELPPDFVAGINRRNNQAFTKKFQTKLLDKITPHCAPEDCFAPTLPMLKDLVLKATKNNVRLVLVNMPLSHWVYEMVPHDAVIQQKLRELKPFLDEHGVPLIDLRYLSQESNFFDWAHVRPKCAHLYGEQLAKALKGILSDNNSNSYPKAQGTVF